VDFSFVEAETRDLYEEDWGRPSWPLEALFRMLFLEYYSNLSDVQVSEQCVYNLLYRWFVGLKVGEVTPDDTTLVVFRKRLGRERVEHGAVVADALYDSSENRKAIHEEKTAEGESVKAYIPSRQKEKNLDRFRYEMKGDRVICPAKQVSIGKSPHEQGHLYYFSVESCRDCPYQEDCPPLNEGMGTGLCE
jgi:transposase